MEFPFIIEPNPDAFDHLTAASGYEQLMLLDGIRRSETWVPIRVAMVPLPERSTQSEPVDFPSLAGGYVASARALEALYPSIGDKIEALPLEAREGKYYAINVLNLLDCLDEARSEFRRAASSRRITVIRKHAFHPGSTDGQHIFKLKQIPLGDVFVSPTFKRTVEEHGLTGLLFHEVGAEAERERTGTSRP